MSGAYKSRLHHNNDVIRRCPLCAAALKSSDSWICRECDEGMEGKKDEPRNDG